MYDRYVRLYFTRCPDTPLYFLVAENIFTFPQTPYRDVINEDNSLLWDFSQIPALEKSLSVLDGEPLQEVVREVMGLYTTHVEPNLCLFQRGNTMARLYV